MLAAPVNEGCDRPAVEIIQAPADKRESLFFQIGGRRREVQFAVEPRLHFMAVGRGDVHDMFGLQRADVGRRYFLRQTLMYRGREYELCEEESKSDANGNAGGRGYPAQRESDRPRAALLLQRRAQAVPKVHWRFEVE